MQLPRFRGKILLCSATGSSKLSPRISQRLLPNFLTQRSFARDPREQCCHGIDGERGISPIAVQAIEGIAKALDRHVVRAINSLATLGHSENILRIYYNDFLSVVPDSELTSELFI